MRIMIASDIHGSTKYCRAMMEAFERENPDRLLLLGDLLYHGPRNGLPVEYDPKQVLEMLNSLKDRILCVRGNCDTEVDQMVLDFPIMAEYCTLFLGNSCPDSEDRENKNRDASEDSHRGGHGRMVFATHGHHFHKFTLPPLQPGDILLHGHTHQPACEEVPLPGHAGDEQENAAVWYLNPGSVSLPKGDSAHSYMMLESSGEVCIFSWKKLDGTVYHQLVL